MLSFWMKDELGKLCRLGNGFECTVVMLLLNGIACVFFFVTSRIRFIAGSIAYPDGKDVFKKMVSVWTSKYKWKKALLVGERLLYGY